MLRGRVGGDGAPFNVGEATVTRAVVELPSGERGYAHILGRDAEPGAARRRSSTRSGRSRRRAPMSRRRFSRRSPRASRPRRPRRAPRPPRPASTSSPWCAARTAHDRARFRRSRLRVAGGFPRGSCARWPRRGRLFACGEALAPPAPLAPAAAAALLTLADFETPLWIAPSFAAASGRGRRLSHVPHRRAARAVARQRRPSR